MKRWIAYDDNPDFGGHQVMACHAIAALAQSKTHHPVFFCSKRNERLIAELETIRSRTGNLDLRYTPLSTRLGQSLRNRVDRPAIARLRHLFAAEDPAGILCIQGEIEDGSAALYAAQTLPAPCISYIPVPHRMALMGAKLGALRDRFNATLFKKPDGWITISESMKERLVERGATAPIKVVHNGIDTARFSPGDPSAARKALGLPSDRLLAGTVGRIEFKQKQQDLLIRMLAQNRDRLASLHLVLVGDGPDRDPLLELIARHDLSDRVTLLPWQSDSLPVYRALDLLLIPSRFEGVPLVMLEALCCAVPVLASACDGMRDLLPPGWTFPPGNDQALADLLEGFPSVVRNELPDLHLHVKKEYTIERFRARFINALDTLHHHTSRKPTSR